MIMKTAEIARLFGMTPRRVNQLAAEGVLPRRSSGDFDAPSCVKAFIAHQSGKVEAKTVELDLDRERARLASEQADGHAIKNAQLRGDLLDRADVEREWSDVLRKVRAGMLAVTSRVRQRLPAIDAAQAEIIDREIRDALTALSHDDNNPPGGAESVAPAAAPAFVGVDRKDDQAS